MRRLSAFVSFVLLLASAGARAGTINVPAGGNLQQAINQAQPGDTILLAAGATFTGNFVLPAKNGTSYITIRSDAPDSSLPAAGQRITPAYASYLPKLQAPAGAGGTPALSTQPYAGYYVIEFVEFLPNPSGTGAMLALGSAESTQNSLAVVPHHISVDRCYLHGYPGQPQLRGIALNSASTTIQNSYISEIKYAGNDSQAVAGWNGPGPYTIVNNYLEAAGENVLLGGSSMFIPNCTPSNIVFRQNHVTKQASWRGSSWTVKNIFELKHAQDVTVDGNVFEYNWQAAQPGYAIVITPRNQYKDNPWTVVQRVTFTNNIVRHVSGAWNVLGWDDESANQNIQTNHLTFRNNMLEDVSSANWGGSGRMMLISETPYVTVDHNTAFNSDSAIYAYNSASNNFVFTNNIVNTASYGITGDSTGGNASTAIATYFPGAIFSDNLFVACPSPGTYPAGNYFPSSYGAVGFANLSGGDYHLASSSIYKGQGTDGKDPGADIDALNAALSGGVAPPPPPPSDAAPSVSLTGPASGATYTAPATIQCTATASDPDATPVARVEFYANGTLVGSATANPFSYTWSGAAAGSYSLTAVAVDTAGLRGTSNAVAVTVVSADEPLPSPWVDADVGAAGLAGSARYSNGTFTVTGAGADVWGSADSFNFLHQALTANGEVMARVVSLQNTNVYAKAGLMIRTTLDANSADVIFDVKPGGGLEFMSRATAGGSTSVIANPAATAPVWLKLVRSDATVTALFSADGSNWTTAGSVIVTLPAAVYVGLAVCSHDVSVLNTATFDNVRVTAGSTWTDQPPSVSITAPVTGASYDAPATIPIAVSASDPDATPVTRVEFYANGTLVGSATTSPFGYTWTNVAAGSYSLTAVAVDSGGLRSTSSAVTVTVTGSTGGGTSGVLPSPWVDQDIGAVQLAGSAGYSGGIFTVIGAGADIWGSADAFNFMYQPMNSDGQIEARILSLENTNGLAKAGIMIRQSLAAGSAAVLLDLTPAGFEFLARASSGSATKVVASGPAATSLRLRLIRSGKSITAYSSPDGVVWTAIGSTSAALTGKVYVGLAVCSHDSGQLMTATFDSVAVSTTKAQPRKPLSYVAVSHRHQIVPKQ